MCLPSYDVIISGASFAGISCAKALALAGCSVLVLERKADVRTGLHTTGILVDEAHRLIDIPPELYKPIREVRLYGPSMRYIEVRSDTYLFYATDTPTLIQHMKDDAESHGVEFLLDTAFVSATEKDGTIFVNNGLAEARFLIGADGAKSTVAEACGLGKNTQFLIGVEAEYTGVTIENPNAFYCLLDQRYAPGYLGWIIPGPKMVQIGVATRHQARPDIHAFYHHISGLLKQDNPQIVERRGGLIPIGGLVRPFYRGNIILLGDAAGMVSPLTAGGIHTALYYGRRLGGLIAAHLKENGPHPSGILAAEYPRFRRKLLMRRLFNHTPNWCLDAMVASPFSQPLANAVFFLKKRLPKQRPKS